MKILPDRIRARFGDVRGDTEAVRVFSNSAWSLAATVIMTGALFAETVILARYLSPAGYGVLLLIIAYPELIQQLLDFRVREGLTKYLGEFLAQDKKAEAVAVVKLLWLLDVLMTLLAFLIVLATAGVAAEILTHRPDLAYLMVIYAAGLLLGAFDTASGSILRVLDRFALAFGVGAGVALVRVGAIVAVVALGGGLEALVFARVAAEAVGTLILGGVAAWQLGKVVWGERRAPIRLLQPRFKEIRAFLVHTNLTGLLRAVSTKLDTVLVGLLGTPSTVSVYKISIQLGTAPLLLGDAFSSAVFPSFARSVALGRIKEMRKLARISSKLTAAIVIPAGMVFAATGGLILATIFGEDYKDAYVPTLLCMAGVIPYVIFFWMQSLIWVTGHAGSLLRIVTIGTLAQFGALALLVPTFGAAGAAASLGLLNLIIVLLEQRFIQRRRLLSTNVAAALPADPAGPTPVAGG